MMSNSFGRSLRNVRNPYSFGRSGSLSGSGKVDIRLVAGIGRAACVILLRKESPERGKSALLWKEWKSVRQWKGRYTSCGWDRTSGVRNTPSEGVSGTWEIRTPLEGVEVCPAVGRKNKTGGAHTPPPVWPSQFKCVAPLS